MGYRIDDDTLQNPLLKGTAHQKWQNELLSLIAELIQEKKHIYWKSYDDPIEAEFNI